MDRLLTDEDMRNIEAKVFRESQPNGEYFERDVKRAIRDKTAHLVAQEIRQQIHYSHQAFTDKYDYEGLDPEVYKFVSGLFSQLEHAIKSKWGIE